MVGVKDNSLTTFSKEGKTTAGETSVKEFTHSNLTKVIGTTPTTEMPIENDSEKVLASSK
jgi:hypothetical protein